MYKNINEYVNEQYKLQFGSLENKDKFFKGLEEIQTAHKDFFESDINNNKDITHYIAPNRPFADVNASLLGIKDREKLPNHIYDEIMELWKSLFD